MKNWAKYISVLSMTVLLGGCGQDWGLDQHGKAVEGLEGRWLIINYWATWCGPCRTEIPEFNALAQTLQSQNTQVLGVNFDGLQGAELAQAAQSLGIEFTVLANDPAERLGIARSAVLPITHIIDPQGQVRVSLPGEQSAAGLIKQLKMLQE